MLFDAEMVESLKSYLVDVATALLGAPLNIADAFYFVYLLSFVGLAYVGYRLYHRGTGTRFVGFLFPKAIYLHPSAKVDYGIYVINVLLSPLILLTAGLQTMVSIEVAEALIALHGSAVFVGNWSAWTFAGFIVGYTLAADLSVYLIHRWHHRSSVLWPLHALHHSAEVLTPFTLFRKHPVWNLTANCLHMLLTGTFQGAFIFVCYGVPGVELLFGINTIYVLYNFFGSNLRHSHVWLSWGKPLSYLFISPAMHQVHHDPKRMNHNYGEMFAVWDWLFGTIYIPKGREEFAIGLGEPNPHTSLARAYYVPLLECVRAFRRWCLRWLRPR